MARQAWSYLRIWTFCRRSFLPGRIPRASIQPDPKALHLLRSGKKQRTPAAIVPSVLVGHVRTDGKTLARAPAAIWSTRRVEKSESRQRAGNPFHCDATVPFADRSSLPAVNPLATAEHEDQCSARLREPATGKVLHTLVGHAEFDRYARLFGRKANVSRLLVGTKTVKIWDSKTARNS